MLFSAKHWLPRFFLEKTERHGLVCHSGRVDRLAAFAEGSGRGQRQPCWSCFPSTSTLLCKQSLQTVQTHEEERRWSRSVILRRTEKWLVWRRVWWQVSRGEVGKEAGKLERRKSYVVRKPPLKHNPKNIIPKIITLWKLQTWTRTSCVVGKPPLENNPRKLELPALIVMLQIFQF